ncbi:FAD-binding domain-containing protein [Metabacillus idriensis]|uniref:FAD-binding domain-containing protein n=1 Tax=Metabacillus idriensis TaxID=324768 RepID=UPI002812D43A|nr:FAD-binding domain-containing protein [Metabacillus idriensis]MDR0139391.1 FAD-binding domain-containing protein [Metabacillus idriensis]
MNVVWFKRDLRIADHKPLADAALYGEVLPLYAAEPSIWSEEDYSARHFQFVRESLEDLQSALEDRGGRLFTHIGEMEEALSAVFKTYGPFTLYAHEEKTGRAAHERNERVREWMNERGLTFLEYPINEKNSGRTFQDRWNLFCQSEPFESPGQIRVPADSPISFHIGAEKLKTFAVSGEPIRFGQQGGEQQAVETLETFLQERFHSYKENGSNLLQSTVSSSRLSPYLAWGNISFRKVVQKTSIKIENCDNLFLVKQLTSFQERLKERCKLMEQENVLESERNPLKKDELFLRWFNGETGIPMIDAAMNCLHKTGWIPSKYRGVLVSFAVNTLSLNVQMCADALASLFLDYEPIIHVHQIQKMSQKVQDPVKIGKKEDSDGVFIKRYLPSLSNVPAKHIHEPWHYPGFFHLDYQAPIVDVKKANQAARKSRSGTAARSATASDHEQLKFDL